MSVRVAAVLCLLVPAAAFAQGQQPLPVFAADVRIFHSSLGQDPVTANDLSVAPTDLPKHALGGMADVHLYLIRGDGWALGLVGEGILAHGRAQQVDGQGNPTGQPVQQYLRGLSGGVSLNFGHRGGWSYVSGAIGPLEFPTYLGDWAPADPAPRQYTVNLGGGARWFASPHLAFCFDVRFYQTTPEVATGVYPSRQRKQLLILSAGISVK